MSHLDEGMIHALLDGEIPSAELPPIQAHLGACAECRARLAEEQALLETTDRLIELIEVPKAAAPVVPQRPGTRRRTWPRQVAWAATVVLAAGIGYSARGSVRLAPEEESAIEDKRAVAETLFARAPEPADPAERVTALRDEPQPGAEGRQSSPPAPANRRKDEATNSVVTGLARARENQERRSAADSVAAFQPITGARAAAAPPAAKVESLPAPPAAPAPLGQLSSARKLGATPMRLEEITVASADARTANARLTTTSPITLPDAIRTLGGASLRLIEGLIPERLEAMGRAVRVVYLTGFGELVLSQELSDGKVQHTLIAPRGFPADSLERLRARVRE